MRGCHQSPFVLDLLSAMKGSSRQSGESGCQQHVSESEQFCTSNL